MKKTLFFPLLTLLLAISADAQECSENEVLLKIEFQDSVHQMDNFESFYWSLAPAAFSGPRAGTTNRLQQYKSPSEVPQAGVRQCILKDECLVLEMTHLDPSQFSIKRDSVPMEIGPAFPHSSYGIFTTTELGKSCIPTCAADESLFQLTAFMSESYRMDWRVENASILQDVSTNLDIEDNKPTPLLQCERRPGDVICRYRRHRLYFERQCLPTSACYHFVAGDLDPKGIHNLHRASTSLNMTFGSDSVVQLQDFRFEATEFGAGCGRAENNNDGAVPSSPVAATTRATGCRPDESLLEFFAWRSHLYETVPDMTWSLSSEFERESLLAQGTIAGHWNDSGALHYVRRCVPAMECGSFSFQVPETLYVEGKAINLAYHEIEPYRVLLDGVIYADKNYRFDAHFGEEPQFQEQVVVGNACPTEAVCNPASESLLEVTIDTAGQREQYSWHVATVGAVPPEQQPRDANFVHKNYLSEMDSSYRFYSCLSSQASSCSQLMFKSRPFPREEEEEEDAVPTEAFPNYTVRLNGKELRERRRSANGSTDITGLGGSGTELCAFAEGEDQNAALIAGLSVGFGFFALFCLAYLRHCQSNTAKADAPSTTSTGNTIPVETATPRNPKPAGEVAGGPEEEA